MAAAGAPRRPIRLVGPAVAHGANHCLREEAEADATKQHAAQFWNLTFGGK